MPADRPDSQLYRRGKRAPQGVFSADFQAYNFGLQRRRRRNSAEPDNPHVRAVREFAELQNAEAPGTAHVRIEAVVISAQIESELAELPPDEAREFLSGLGVETVE